MRSIYAEFKLPLRKVENVDAFFEEGLTHLGVNAALLGEVLAEVKKNHAHIMGEQKRLVVDIEKYKATLSKIAVLEYAQKVAGGARTEKDINSLMNDDEGAAADLSEGLLANNDATATRLVYLGGVMPQADLAAFRRMIVRVSRGKVIVASTEFNIPFNDRLLAEPEYGQGMSVFLLAFEVGDFIMERIKRIAASFKTFDIIEVTMGKLG